MPIRRIRASQSLIAYWLIIAFAVRALLPHGFMPGSEPFSLKLCPTGLPVQALALAEDPHAAHQAHHAHAVHPEHDSPPATDHQTHHLSADQCPFGAASAAIAVAHVMAALVPWLESAQYAIPAAISDPDTRPSYRPQPRGPPAFS